LRWPGSVDIPCYPDTPNPVVRGPCKGTSQRIGQRPRSVKLGQSDHRSFAALHDGLGSARLLLLKAGGKRRIRILL
jgi:hypothetical protein